MKVTKAEKNLKTREKHSIKKGKEIYAKGKMQSGITLIALIVTIIVLLILAGVSIATLIGDNGILTQANNAKERTEEAEQEEKDHLNATEDFINEYLNIIEVEQVTDENPGVLETEGTDTYVINSIEDLVFFASDVRSGNTYEGQTVELGTSLDFNSDKSYVDPLRTDYGKYGYEGELKTLLTSGEGFIPIGSISDASFSFEGTFDGKENNLYNLYINYSNVTGESSIGLFGTNNGIINNVEIRKIDINVKNDSEYKSYVGGIVGTNVGTISECSISGILVHNSKAENGLGGIAGHSLNGGIITDSINKATLEGNSMTGGISGYWTGGVISNCKNEGKVETNADSNYCYAGGIASALGDNENNQIISCYNTGTIIANATGNRYIQAGGIAGYSGGNVLNCVNEGEISATHSNEGPNVRVGGILGVNAKNVENCVNQGKVQCNRENIAAGLVTNNTGNIKSSKYLTGILGIIINTGTTSEVEELQEKLNYDEILDILNK